MIYILRHAKADQTPQKKILESEVERAKKLAEFLNGKIKANSIYSSPLLRALQTAEIFSQILKLNLQKTEILAGQDAYEIYRFIISNQFSIFVGHQPVIGNVVARIVFGDFRDFDIKPLEFIAINNTTIEFILNPDVCS